MAVRLALYVIAAATLAIASPGLAQEPYDPGLPPPLPDLVEDELDDEIEQAIEGEVEREIYDAPEDYSDYAESDGPYDEPADLAPVAWSDPRFGYSEDQRAAWYTQCRALYGITESAFDTCGDHLVRYEQAYVAYLDAMGQDDCCCEEEVEVIIEEEIADEPAPIRRQRQPDKRVKLEPL